MSDITLQKNTVVVVDDEEVALFIMRKLFQAISPELEVITFDNPVEALEGLKKLPPSLVFFDLNMPQLNGWQMIEQAMKKGMQHTFVLITSSTSRMDDLKSREYPLINGHFVKPVSKQQLEDTLNGLAII